MHKCDDTHDCMSVRLFLFPLGLALPPPFSLFCWLLGRGAARLASPDFPATTEPEPRPQGVVQPHSPAGVEGKGPVVPEPLLVSCVSLSLEERLTVANLC